MSAALRKWQIAKDLPKGSSIGLDLAGGWSTTVRRNTLWHWMRIGRGFFHCHRALQGWPWTTCAAIFLRWSVAIWFAQHMAATSVLINYAVQVGPAKHEFTMQAAATWLSVPVQKIYIYIYIYIYMYIYMFFNLFIYTNIYIYRIHLERSPSPLLAPKVSTIQP